MKISCICAITIYNIGLSNVVFTFDNKVFKLGFLGLLIAREIKSL